jgi:hypothetical protein
MSVVTRRFSACPVRTAANTWANIVNTIAGTTAEVRTELIKIEGIAASIIADETPKKNPITIIGTGSRLRIYCLYDEDGSTEDANESPLNWNLFASVWEIHFPVEKDDLGWIKKALSEKGYRFNAYVAGTKPDADDDIDKNDSQPSYELTIDISKL